MIKDSFGRIIDYVRISVTDRCNLRCYYCMPKDIIFAPKNELLSYEEMLSLLKLLKDKGIRKVRITGGEAGVGELICTVSTTSEQSNPKEGLRKQENEI